MHACASRTGWLLVCGARLVGIRASVYTLLFRCYDNTGMHVKLERTSLSLLEVVLVLHTYSYIMVCAVRS